MVTGASSGIGQEMVRHFCRRREGRRPHRDRRARVRGLRRAAVKHWRRTTRAASRPPRLPRRPRRPRTPSWSSPRTIIEAHGNIDILVNNAGYTTPAPIQQIDFADFERTIAVNLYAPFTIVQAAAAPRQPLRASSSTSPRPPASRPVRLADLLRVEGRAHQHERGHARGAARSTARASSASRPGAARPRCGACSRPTRTRSTIMQPEHVADVIEMLASPVGRFVDSQNLVVRL